MDRLCPDHVLLLMLSGCLRFSEADKPVALYPGDWYIQPAGLEQRGIQPSDQPLYFYVHFHARIETADRAKQQPDNSQMDSQLRGSPARLPGRGRFDPERCQADMQQLWSMQIRQPSHLFGLNAQFHQLLYRLSQAQADDASEQRSGELLQLLERAYRNRTELADLAASCHYSTDHLIRKVKAACGRTPAQYMQHLRLRDACQQLLHTNRSVQVIAETAGFADVVAMFRAFQKTYGMSPTLWRSLHAQDIALQHNHY